jgi:predicted nucleotidyltransferase
MNQVTAIKNRLLDHKKSLFQKYPIKELAIFGSYARNEQSPTSDLDLLVEFHSRVGSEFIELGDELEDLLGIKVDLVSNKGIKPRYLEQIKEERENLALRETRTVTGVSALQSPITFLYQAFSKKEQNKRWIAEQEYKDDQRRIVQELLRLYVAFDIIELTEAEFDAFITFLNIDEQFIKTASEMELILFIKDKYDHFRRL